MTYCLARRSKKCRNTFGSKPKNSASSSNRKPAHQPNECFSYGRQGDEQQTKANMDSTLDASPMLSFLGSFNGFASFRLRRIHNVAGIALVHMNQTERARPSRISVLNRQEMLFCLA